MNHLQEHHPENPVSLPIETVLDEHTEQVSKKIKRARIVGGAALVALTGWLSWLHGQIASLDAEAMATLAQERAKAALPGVAQDVRHRLEQAAPGVVDRCVDKLLEAPPLLRAQLEEQADVLFTHLTGELQRGFAEHISMDVGKVRSVMADRYGALDERDQLRAMVHDYARDYSGRVLTALTAPAPDADRIFGELAHQVERLAAGAQLGRKERIQRDILATLLALAPRLEHSEELALGTLQLGSLEDLGIF